MTNLKRIRQQRGLTQKQLAEKSGVSLKMIQKYETGEKDINHARILTVWQLAVALICSLNSLIETTPEYKGKTYYILAHSKRG